MLKFEIYKKNDNSLQVIATCKNQEKWVPAIFVNQSQMQLSHAPVA